MKYRIDRQCCLDGKCNKCAHLPTDRHVRVFQLETASKLAAETVMDAYENLGLHPQLYSTNAAIRTYGEMLAALEELTPEQLDSHITIELEWEDECIPAEFRICGKNHSMLDDGHPVIFTLAR